VNLFDRVMKDLETERPLLGTINPKSGRNKKRAALLLSAA
jgi:hypothetical protein